MENLGKMERVRKIGNEGGNLRDWERGDTEIGKERGENSRDWGRGMAREIEKDEDWRD